jgi:hypothetical protein
MRIKLALASAVIAVAACAKGETPPAGDSAAPVAAETARAPITMASLAGRWNVNVMGESSDSVVTTNVSTFTDNPPGGSFRFPNGPEIPIRNVTVSGDSITYEAGPFASAVRPGMRVSNRVAMTMRDGNMVGNVTARYETTGPDSVRHFRLVATRAP